MSIDRIRHLVKAALFRAAMLRIAGKHELAQGAKELADFLRAKLSVARAAVMAADVLRRVAA